jgi:soluble lytic murein transglycosylase-like protein
MIERIANAHDLRPELIHAVIRAESAYQADAVSSKGAVGLMQLMPATAERYGVVDRSDPEQNVQGGVAYLRDLLELFESDLRLALAAYNAGENAVMRYGNAIPPYPETQNYVRKVIRFYNDQLPGDQVALN